MCTIINKEKILRLFLLCFYLCFWFFSHFKFQKKRFWKFLKKSMILNDNYFLFTIPLVFHLPEKKYSVEKTAPTAHPIGIDHQMPFSCQKSEK